MSTPTEPMLLAPPPESAQARLMLSIDWPPHALLSPGPGEEEGKRSVVLLLLERRGPLMLVWSVEVGIWPWTEMRRKSEVRSEKGEEGDVQ